MNLFTPPQKLPSNGLKSVFLAGTIDKETGSENWQKVFYEKLSGYDINIFNPRRIVFDEKDIHEQITWELDALEQSTLIAMNFELNSKSVITLLEFGLYAKTNKLVVCCPKEFYRYDNIYITSKYYGVKLFDNKSDLLNEIIKHI